MKITFVGNGKMALALAKGLSAQYEIEVIGRDISKLDLFEDELGTKITKIELTDACDVTGKTLIFAVKPYNLEEVGKKLQGEAKALYSVLAGTTLESLQKHIQATSYVRAMPNVAAEVNLSMTTLTGDEDKKEEALSIFQSVGTTVWLGTQKELDIATALAGSGPAYLALIAEALTDGAVKEGLKRDDASKITAGLFSGFAKLLEKKHPALLKDSVMSPGGTTAAGYAALERNGVRSAMIETISAAYKRALELS